MKKILIALVFCFMASQCGKNPVNNPAQKPINRSIEWAKIDQKDSLNKNLSFFTFAWNASYRDSEKTKKYDIFCIDTALAYGNKYDSYATMRDTLTDSSDTDTISIKILGSAKANYFFIIIPMHKKDTISPFSEWIHDSLNCPGWFDGSGNLITSDKNYFLTKH